jgi:hypothetical protein
LIWQTRGFGPLFTIGLNSFGHESDNNR